MDDLIKAVELALIILARDGIRPLLGEAFTQTDIETLQNAVKAAGGDPNPAGVWTH